MTSMWLVTLVVSVGIAALTVRTIQVTVQRDRYQDMFISTEQQLITAWDAQGALMQEVQELELESQYLLDTISYWAEDRLTESKWDNSRYATYQDEEAPF